MSFSLFFPAPTFYRFFLTVHPSLACVQTPLPPSPQENSDKGPLLRFFLRGEGYVHRQEGGRLLTQAIHHKTLFSFIFLFVLSFYNSHFGGTTGFSLIKFT